MKEYVKFKTVKHLPRLPREGFLDLTYRCNNNCRHCWLRIPPDSPEKEKELSFEEIRRIIDEAKKSGCRSWYISGGEPMLRPDFKEIFDYITRNSSHYSLNTNGTLITPEIARLMKRKGNKWIALYGATADVHDHITRTPGSFAAKMKAFSYLKEADTDFTVQLIPLRDNYHQFPDMIKLAESLSPRWRIGALWCYLSASRDAIKNEEIKSQRLSPAEVVKLEKPGIYIDNELEPDGDHIYCNNPDGNHLLSACIATRTDFHIDPYGQMSFCSFIKEPGLRYDLRQGNFQKGWEIFIPSLADKIKGGDEFQKNCGSCQLREDCSWCPVYAWLEHGRFSAKVDYLCQLARENKKLKENWKKSNRRYYQIAGITIQVNSDLPISDTTFLPVVRKFEVDNPGDDVIILNHHFSLPDLKGQDLGRKIYRHPPWAIYRKKNSWIYLGISEHEGNESLYQVAVFNHDHTVARIYHHSEDSYLKGNLQSLALLPTDQIILARMIPDRQGLFLHSSGVIFKGMGMLFVGKSEAGKSTMVKMLKDKAEILCDDRNIIRNWPDGFKIHGTWSHGEIPQVSPNSAPLKAIFFLKKARKNRIMPVSNKPEAMKNIIGCLIKPLVTADWWDKIFTILEKLIEEIPCYNLHFDKSGQIVNLLEDHCFAQVNQKKI